jgi:hypothetical protein
LFASKQLLSSRMRTVVWEVDAVLYFVDSYQSFMMMGAFLHYS